MDNIRSSNKNTLYAFEKVDLKYDYNDKVKISTLGTRVTTINVDGKDRKLVIFCRNDVAVKNLKTETHRLNNLKADKNKTVKYLTNYLKSTGMNENKIHILMEQIKIPHAMLGEYTQEELKIQKDAVAAQNGELVDGKELSDEEVNSLCQQSADIKTKNFNSSKFINFISAKHFESDIQQPIDLNSLISQNKTKTTEQLNHHLDKKSESPVLDSKIKPKPLPKSPVLVKNTLNSLGSNITGLTKKPVSDK